VKPNPAQVEPKSAHVTCEKINGTNGNAPRTCRDELRKKPFNGRTNARWLLRPGDHETVGSPVQNLDSLCLRVCPIEAVLTKQSKYG